MLLSTIGCWKAFLFMFENCFVGIGPQYKVDTRECISRKMNPTQITEYDDKLVRKYINQIKIYDDKFVVCFKAKMEINVLR